MKYEILFCSRDMLGSALDPGMVWKKGYPIMYKEEGWQWGAMDRLPTNRFRIGVECTEEQAQSVTKPWRRITSYNILDFDAVTDSFKVAMFAVPEGVSVSGIGQVSVEELEQFLTEWGAVVLHGESADNDVRFTLKAMDALNGKGYVYFGEEDEYVVFTEIEYDIITGTHIILADFSNSNLKSIRKALEFKGCTVMSENENTGAAVFSTTRDIMRERLERSVRERFDIQIGRVVRYLPPEYVDSVTALGGYKEETWVGLSGILLNKLEE
jgi:hypothetical protein